MTLWLAWRRANHSRWKEKDANRLAELPGAPQRCRRAASCPGVPVEAAAVADTEPEPGSRPAARNCTAASCSITIPGQKGGGHLADVSLGRNSPGTSSLPTACPEKGGGRAEPAAQPGSDARKPRLSAHTQREVPTRKSRWTYTKTKFCFSSVMCVCGFKIW